MARGCSFLHLPQNDATVTVEVEDSTHNKISYSAKLGNELGLTPCGYRVYHAEFKDSTEEEGEYKVAKDKSVCPYCQRVRNNASTKNIIYEKNESELSHCRTISGEYTGMRRYVPAKLQIELYKNKCGYCNKPYRDTLSDLREGNKHYTPALEKYIREVSVQSDLTELANKFSVSKKEVFAWYKEQVEYRDSKSRKVPQPKSLGLYTLTFNDTATDSAGKKINAGKKAAYCLCVDEENQTFIGFFPWHDAAKKKAFFDSISNMGVHILDPFTGTGTFIVRLLHSGIIRPEDLLYKYTSEIHCNEIVLLAYYIAAVNIEETYHELSQSENYVPFNGIVLTDTFELAERVGTREGEADTSVFQPNADRATKQMQTPIQVIIGNPPYSVGQKNGNDNNQNVSYEHLEKAIANTYVANSKAALKRNAYESSVMAIRWATDRISENGIVAFVTNGSFVNSNAHDGFRKCLLNEYNSVYCFDLRGDQRIQGEASRKEGGKIFGSGSRARIAIIVLVKKKGVKKDGYVRYYDIGDYLSRNEKLQIIKDFGSVKDVPWKYVTPDENNDWLNHRNPAFSNFVVLGDKKKRDKVSYYADNYAMGLSTNRDVWIYSFSKECTNATRMIEFYNAELDRCETEYQNVLSHQHFSNIDDLKKTVYTNCKSNDSHNISWSAGLLNRFLKGKRILPDAIMRTVMHRPFTKEYCYFNTDIIERPSKWESFFPNEGMENYVICVSGSPLKRPFCTLMTDCIQDLHLLENSQCFPLYVYEKEKNKEAAQLSFENMTEGESVKWHKRSAITDVVLSKFRSIYGDRVTKEDIFYYIYAVFQSKGYIAEYADNLSKEMPRIPMLAHFPKYVKIGRALADLHLHYEKPVTAAEIGVTVDMRTEDYTIVDKMRFGKGKDKSIIEYNPYITIRDIPTAAYDYIVNGKSAIEWIVEQYAVTTDKASGIVNDPNTYAGGKYVFDLLLSIISVSLKTQELIAQLPEYKEI